MPSCDSLTMVIPMWNEAASIRHAVDAALEEGTVLMRCGEIRRFDVLIVDDASTDGTGPIADAIAASDPRVSVVHHETNRKLGGALRTGFARATGELVLYTDADLPFDLDELGKALRLLRVYDADIVSAFRLDRTGEGPRRRVYSFCYNNLVQLLLGVRLRDVNFSFKLVRRSVLDRVELRSEGSFIDVELLARAQRLGFRVIQFGVDYFPRTRGVSTLSSNAVIVTMLKEMAALRGDLRRLRPLPPSELGHEPAGP